MLVSCSSGDIITKVHGVKGASAEVPGPFSQGKSVLKSGFPVLQKFEKLVKVGKMTRFLPFDPPLI